MTQANIVKARGRSVKKQPAYEQTPFSGFVFSLASAADLFTPWGTDVARRDIQLRSFVPTESILASALYSVIARNAAYSWTLDGPPKTVEIIQEMLHNANEGKGWLDWISKTAQDIFSQDNGAFTEIIRAGEEETSPVLGISHLDSGRCRRTGIPDFPVVYQDRMGGQHKMRPWQIITWEEYPSPVETLNGVQLCAVSRVLTAAQLLRDVSVYQREKVGGRNPQAIHLVSGINQKVIEDYMTQKRSEADQKGFLNYILPMIFSTLDPTATVNHVEIPLASLPDGFDYEQIMRWYISQLALGFGVDYQDFAPLPGGGLGTSSQSLILHMKSRGKGPALFMKIVEHKFNYHGIIPQNVTFKYDERDPAGEKEEADIALAKAQRRQLYVQWGILSAGAIRQEMLDDGEIAEEIFKAENQGEDVTTDVTSEDATRVESKERKADFMDSERRKAEKELQEALIPELAAIWEEVKKVLLSKKSLLNRKQGPEDILSDASIWEKFRVRMIGAMIPAIRKGALEAVIYNGRLGLRFNFDKVNDEVLAFSRTYSNDWWLKLSDSTRNSLQEAITTWQQSGLGDRGLPDLIDSLEPVFGPARAERIATTEVTRIFDEGNRLAHIEAGVEEEEWQTAQDEVVCEICIPLDGKRFPTDEGPRPVADTHIGCRCARLPVAGDEVLG